MHENKLHIINHIFKRKYLLVVCLFVLFACNNVYSQERDTITIQNTANGIIRPDYTFNFVIPEISSKDYFIHGFALFDKAAKQEVERYTWKTDNYYSNKTGISIADANSITITYNTTTQTEINIRIAKVVSGNCFFSYTDVLYNPNSKEILTNPVRWTHRGRLFNADPNCDYLLVSDPSESEECFNPEFVEAQKARLTGIIDTIDRIKDKDIEPLINSLNGYCSTALGNLGGELLLKAINHIGLMDNIPSDNEKAILRMLEVLPSDYYSALITKLSNNEYALLNNLLKEFNDAFL